MIGGFSDEYRRLLDHTANGTAEEQSLFPESLLLCVWQDQMFDSDVLATDTGIPVRIVSPGWRNPVAGPDFRNAQIRMGDQLLTGDVELHVRHADWRLHGHQNDPEYDRVLLNVVLESDGRAGDRRLLNSKGERIPCLCVGPHLNDEARALTTSLADDLSDDAGSEGTERGLCAALSWPSASLEHSHSPLSALIRLAGEWRMLAKARLMRERMAVAGAEQALYEGLMTACGYSAYKEAFHLLARRLTYARVRELAQSDPMLLEAAMFVGADLMPETAPQDHGYWDRMDKFRKTRLTGIIPMPVLWTRKGVRPVNYPERRLCGAARLLSRTADTGLLEAVDHVWRQELTPGQRCTAFAALFPNRLGFWGNHCTWNGKAMRTSVAPIGEARIFSIIGNVFVPMAIALARTQNDRLREERVLEFFHAMPGESENRTVKRMALRLYGSGHRLKVGFAQQQGMLQMFHDYCGQNPSCRNCGLLRQLDVLQAAVFGDE